MVCRVRFGVCGASRIRMVEAGRLGRLACFVVGPKATIVQEPAKWRLDAASSRMAATPSRSRRIGD